MSLLSSHIAAIGTAGAIVLGVFGITANPAPPISVHSLMYEPDCQYRGVNYQHCIRQDRTIKADGEFFYMFWEAALHGPAGPVSECTGAGSWKYNVGRSAHSMPLDLWTGNPDCDYPKLLPGEYTPIAVWFFGDAQVTFKGQTFTVPGE